MIPGIGTLPYIPFSENHFCVFISHKFLVGGIVVGGTIVGHRAGENSNGEGGGGGGAG